MSLTVRPYGLKINDMYMKD